jgi:hypothetical protein
MIGDRGWVIVAPIVFIRLDARGVRRTAVVFIRVGQLTVGLPPLPTCRLAQPYSDTRANGSTIEASPESVWDNTIDE